MTAPYQSSRGTTWENDESAWPDDARYRHASMAGVAFRVYGWEVEPDEDTVWSGCYVRTGRVVAVMVGDDYRHRLDPEDFAVIDDLDYCAECGQIGCTHDGRDREEAAS